MVRVALQQAFQGGDPFLRAISAQMNSGQRDIRGLVLRPLLKQLFQQGHRRIPLPARREDQREVVGRLAIVAAPGERIPETPFRLGEIAGAAGQQAQIVERLGEIRLQRQRLFVERPRLLIASSEQKRIAKVVQRVRVLGVDASAVWNSRIAASSSPLCASNAPRSL